MLELLIIQFMDFLSSFANLVKSFLSISFERKTSSIKWGVYQVHKVLFVFRILSFLDFI